MTRRWAGLALLAMLVGCQSRTEPPQVTQGPPPDSPVIAQALQAGAEGRLEDGLQALAAEIVKHPADSRLYATRATLEHRAGLHDAALADLNQALSLTPDDVQLLNNRGFVLLSLERYDAAIADLERALELDPQAASASNNRGLVSLAQGKHRDAVVWFSRALDSRPKYVDALNNRGFAWMQLGRLENAYADLNEVVRISPKYVNALDNRGLLKARAGEREAAILDFTEAMILDPLNPKYYEHRSESYRLLGKIDESLADQRKVEWLVRLQALDRAVAAEPRSVAARVSRALHYWEHGDEPHARSDLAQALELDPADGRAVVLQARLKLAAKDYDAALAWTESALDSAEATAAWSVRGDAFFALGRYDEALDCFTHAKRFDGSMAEIYYRKSQALASQGDAESAEAQLDLARQLDPEIEERLR